MGQILSFCLYAGVVSAAMVPALKAMAHLRALGDDHIKEWNAEYAIRLCSGLAAAEANLKDAAQYLSERHPAERAQIAADAQVVSRSLQASYPHTLLATPSGFCQSPLIPELRTVLHRQRHEGEPRFWPNWVLRFTE